MSTLLTIAGVLMVLAGLLYGVTMLSGLDTLNAALLQTSLSYSDRLALSNQKDYLPWQALGSLMGGIAAALPYFALARLLRRGDPPMAPTLP